MAQGTIPFFLQQLAYQLPMVLVFLAGAIAAGMMMRYHRMASLLCLAGCVTSLLTILALTGIQGWLFEARLREAWPVTPYSQAMALVGLVGAILRPIGLALIVIAVFIGRKPSLPVPEA